MLCSPGGTNRLFAWESGVDGFLATPFHIDELLAQIREIVERPEGERRQHRRTERDLARDGGRRDPTGARRRPLSTQGCVCAPEALCRAPVAHTDEPVDG